MSENKGDIISRDKLNTGIALFMAENSYLNMSALDVLKMVAEWVTDAPSVDAQPVAHGRWKDQPSIKSFRHTNIPVVVCSNCGMNFCDIINNHREMYRYCPYCGAKMDGGDTHV